jgi:hypothetical protein
MTKFFHLVVFSIFVANFSTSPAFAGQSHIWKNMDGSRAIATPDGSGGYIVRLAGSRRLGEALRIAPSHPEFSETFSVRFLDFKVDGFAVIETSEACGNKVCHHKFYVFDVVARSWVLVYEGAYGSAAVSGDFLVLDSKSGCCQHEVSLFRFSRPRRAVAEKPDYKVTVRSEHLGLSERVTCEIVGGDQKLIATPDKYFLRYCESFGAKYQLVVNDSGREPAP